MGGEEGAQGPWFDRDEAALWEFLSGCGSDGF